MGRIRAIINSPRLAAMAVLALGGLAIFLINFPGSMEDDSFVQLLEGRTGSYSGWHPAVMSWMLGVSDALPGPPASWFTGFVMLVVFSSLIGVVALAETVSWRTVLVAAVILLLPQMLLLQAVVWKDTLFADSVLAGFVCLGLGVKTGPRWRWGLILLGAAFFALAALSRQNGIVTVPCAAVVLGLVVARRGPVQKGLITAGGFLLAFVVFWQGGNGLLKLRWDGYPAAQEQFKILELYDITGMVVRARSLPLTALDRKAPQLAHIIRGEGVARWSPLKNDTLEMSPRIVAALDATSPVVLARQWRETVWHNPAGYLAVRALLFRWVFQPPDVSLCHPFHVGDQGDADDLKVLGIKPRLDARDLMLWRIGDLFLQTPVFSHGLFSLLALGVLIVIMRRRSDSDLIMAGLIVSAYVFTATFLVISIACDYRYLYLDDLVALAGVLYIAADWRALATGKTKRGPEGPL